MLHVSSLLSLAQTLLSHGQKMGSEGNLTENAEDFSHHNIFENYNSYIQLSQLPVI